MNRRLQFAALATVLAISARTPAAAASFTLRYIGEQRIATGTLFQSVEFDGISGLDYDASTGRYHALADDRGGDRGGERGAPRFYTLSLDYGARGFLRFLALRASSVERSALKCSLSSAAGWCTQPQPSSSSWL